MPDLRELAILNTQFAATFPPGRLKKVIGDVRMALRRLVVRTAFLPGFRTLYTIAYKAHVLLMKKIALSFPDTRSVYLTAGMGRGELRLGISDIDFVILGKWDEKTQFQLLKRLAVFVILLPLFDSESLGSIQTWNDLLHLNNSDPFFAYQYATARQNWKLLAGEDLIQELPDLLWARRAGSAQMEMGRWWGGYTRVALGEGVTARDPLFRNSFSFKAVADVLRAERIAAGDLPPRNRKAILEQLLGPEDVGLKRMLLAAEAASFLRIEGDPVETVMPWLLQRIDRWNGRAAQMESYRPVASVRLEGNEEERILTGTTLAHAEHMADAAAKIPGFQFASLAPCALFMGPDTVGLFLSFDLQRLPSAREFRSLMQLHYPGLRDASQRMPVYLLGEYGAYTLDSTFGLELWCWSLVPHVSSDVFAHVAEAGYLLRGEISRVPAPLQWTSMAEELLEEEIMIRRAAYARFGVLARPSAIENLRNLWRILQLQVMADRSENNEVVVPTSVAAISRCFLQRAPDLSAELEAMHTAFRDALTEKEPHADAAMLKVYDWLRSHAWQG